MATSGLTCANASVSALAAQRQRGNGRRLRKPAQQSHPGPGGHGQFTEILLAKFAPMPILASDV